MIACDYFKEYVLEMIFTIMKKVTSILKTHYIRNLSLEISNKSISISKSLRYIYILVQNNYLKSNDPNIYISTNSKKYLYH